MLTDKEVLLRDGAGRVVFDKTKAGSAPKGLKNFLVQTWCPGLVAVSKRRTGPGSSKALGTRIHAEVMAPNREKRPLAASRQLEECIKRQGLVCVDKEVFLRDPCSSVVTFVDMVARPACAAANTPVTLIEIKTFERRAASKTAFLPPLVHLPCSDTGFAHAQLACAVAMAVDGGVLDVSDALVISKRGSVCTATRCLQPFLATWSISAVVAVGRQLLAARRAVVPDVEWIRVGPKTVS
jgi:hypothetical protein